MSVHQRRNLGSPCTGCDQRHRWRSRRQLAARLEPFNSYWQAPADVDTGYAKFAAYYRANYLPHLPADRSRAHPGRQLWPGLSGGPAA